MADSENWAIPVSLRPNPSELRFDLARALEAVVQLRAQVPEDAFTAQILGTERFGNAVVIRDDGLILTIGYLITEAESVWLTTHDGRVVPGHPLAYDQATGFGLVLPLGRLGVPALPRGSMASATVGEEVFVIAHGGRQHALKAHIVAKREFAGYWEYVLDEALFTAPPHPRWSGAALVDHEGRLLGIGSLFVQETVEEDTVEGNLFVPVDLLEPILESMLNTGRSSLPPRPWLGMYTAEMDNQLVVAGLATDGPADRAGVKVGDRVLEVGEERPSGLADLFRRIWRMGSAGAEVPLTLARNETIARVRVHSADRNEFLRKPNLQ